MKNAPISDDRGVFVCVGKTSVGAGLLANAVCQSISMCLTHRIREQARSHKGFSASGLLRPRRSPRTIELQQVAVAPQLAHLLANPARPP